MLHKFFSVSLTMLMLAASAIADEPDTAQRDEQEHQPQLNRADGDKDGQDRPRVEIRIDREVHRGRGPNKRGPDQRGPDQRGPEKRGPDQRGPDQRGPDQRGWRSPEHARAPEPKHSGERRGDDRIGLDEFRERIELQFRQLRERRERERAEHEHSERAEHAQRERQELERDRDQMAERIDHLHQAADHLRHANMGEFAERVMEHVKDLERALHHAGPEHREPPHRGPNPELRELHSQINDLRRAVQELNEQMQQIRRGMER